MSCSMKSLLVASSSAISRAAVKLAPVLTSLLRRRQQRPSSPRVAAEQQQTGSRLPETLRLNLQTATKQRRGLEVRVGTMKHFQQFFCFVSCPVLLPPNISEGNLVNDPLLSLCSSAEYSVCVQMLQTCCRWQHFIVRVCSASRDDGWTTSVFVCCQYLQWLMVWGQIPAQVFHRVGSRL